jgi:hypothetical protein
MSRIEVGLHRPPEHMREGRGDGRQGLQDCSANAATSSALKGGTALVVMDKYCASLLAPPTCQMARGGGP